MGQTAEELRRQLDEQRDVVGRDMVAIGDRVSPGRMVERRRSAVRQRVGRMRDTVMGAADEAGSAASERVGGATDALSSAAASVTGTVAGAPDAVRTQTQGNPFAAGLVAFGAGALVGSLLPASRLEQQRAQSVQPALESAAADVGQQAQSVADTVTEHAQEAADRLKGSAQESAEAVKASTTG